MAGSEAVDSPSSRRWAAFAGIENRLVRTVAGVPATVRTKLLLSFLVIAALLVLVCVLGLRVLGQANARVERLGQLQLRSTRYQVLEQSANDMEQALGARSAGAPGFAAYTGGKKIGGGRQWQRVDLSLSDLLSQVELNLDEPTFGFVPPPGEERALSRIRLDYRRLVRDVDRISRLDTANIRGAVSYAKCLKNAGFFPRAKQLKRRQTFELIFQLIQPATGPPKLRVNKRCRGLIKQLQGAEHQVKKGQIIAEPEDAGGSAVRRRP